MEPDFDPYRKWLGIPPQDQPPNHYRLLGLEPFEPDPDVITTAADGRMAQIKRFQTGKYSAHSQRLLNEIARAKVCLLNAEQKAEYDARLREQLSRSAQDAAERGSSPRKPPPRRAAERIALSAGVPSASVASYLASRRRSAQPRVKVTALVALGMVTLGLCGLGSWIWWNRTPRSEPSLAQRPGPEASGPASGPGGAPAGSATGAQSPPGQGPNHDGSAGTDISGRPAEPPMPAAEPAQPLEPLPGATPGEWPGGSEPAGPEAAGPTAPPPQDPLLKPLEQLIDPEGPGETQQPTVQEEAGSEPETPAGEVSPSGKLPVPDALALREAEQQIREVFGRELAEADTPEKKAHLAELLFQQSQEVLKKAEIRFVAVQMAGRLAAEGRELERALATADWLGEHYQVNVWQTKAGLLAQAFQAAGSAAPGMVFSEQIFQAASDLMDRAAVQDQYDAAEQLLRVATMAARRTRDTTRLRQVTVFERELSRRKLRFQAVQDALQLLSEQPDDADANLTVGRWYCFQKGDWERGLPYLSRGSDERLAQLARQELAGATDVSHLVQIADQWSRLVGAESGPDKAAMLDRAVEYYEQALPSLDGLEKVRVEKELATLHASQGVADSASPPAGAIVDGNVALAARGTTIEGAQRAEVLLDGDAVNFDGHNGFAYAKTPCTWTVTFPRVYRLQMIRFRFYETDNKISYRYQIETSPDGRVFEPLVDRSRGEWQGWQVLAFRPRAVKAIRIHGLYCSAGDNFLMVEFEAYCRAPGSQ